MRGLHAFTASAIFLHYTKSKQWQSFTILLNSNMVEPVSFPFIHCLLLPAFLQGAQKGVATGTAQTFVKTVLNKFTFECNSKQKVYFFLFT